MTPPWFPEADGCGSVRLSPKPCLNPGLTDKAASLQGCQDRPTQPISKAPSVLPELHHHHLPASVCAERPGPSYPCARASAPPQPAAAATKINLKECALDNCYSAYFMVFAWV